MSVVSVASSVQTTRRVKRKAPPSLAPSELAPLDINPSPVSHYHDKANSHLYYDSVTIVTPVDSVVSLASPRQFVLTPEGESAVEAAYRSLTADYGKSKAEPTTGRKKSKGKHRSMGGLSDEPHYQRRAHRRTSPNSTAVGPPSYFTTHYANHSSASVATSVATSLAASSFLQSDPAAARRPSLQHSIHGAAPPSLIGEELTRVPSNESTASHASRFTRLFRGSNGSRTSLVSTKRKMSAPSIMSVGSRSVSTPAVPRSSLPSGGHAQTLHGVPSELHWRGERGYNASVNPSVNPMTRSVSELPRPRVWTPRRQRTTSSPKGPSERGEAVLYRETVQEEHASPTQLPTYDELRRAAELTVVAESGLRVRFGDVFTQDRTVVCFIRHFWCPSCQDYMKSITEKVDSVLLSRLGINVIIVGNGSPTMIKSYRQIFQTPFPIFVDPSLELYRTLGMTRCQASAEQDQVRGDYVKHGAFSGLAKVVRRALKVRMPVWEKGGDTEQLGGEFVMGPGLNCTYAHRMISKQSHAPILSVLDAAGMNREVVSLLVQPSSAVMPAEEEPRWMAKRQDSYERLQEKRRSRRGGASIDESFNVNAIASLTAPIAIPNSSFLHATRDIPASMLGTPDLERSGSFGDISSGASSEDEQAAVTAGEVATRATVDREATPDSSDIDWSVVDSAVLAAPRLST